MSSRGRRRPRSTGRDVVASSPAPALRWAGVVLIALHVALVPLVFDPSALVAFAIPKALLAQALGALLLGVLIATLVREGRGALVVTPIHIAVAVLGLLYVAASVVALNIPIAIRGALDRALGLTTFADGVVLFVAMPLFIRRRIDAVILGSAFFVGAVPVLAYEIVQATGADPLPWKGGIPRTRPVSTLGNATVLGQYLGCIAVAAAATVAQRSIPMGPIVRVTLAALAVIAVVGALATGTRAVFLGLAAVVLVVAVLLLVGLRPHLRLIVGSASAVLALGTTFGVVLTPLGQRIEGTFTSVEELATTQAGRDGSVAARLVLYEVAFRELQDRPLLGLGPDNYTVAFPRYRPEGADRILSTFAPETSPHSWVLKVATDAGVLGLAAFIGAALAAVAHVLRGGARPLALVAVSTLAAFLGAGLVSVNDPGTDWIYWSALGAIAASSGPVLPVPAGRPRARLHAIGKAVASGALIGAVAIAILSWTWLDAARAAGASSSARSFQRWDPAVVAAERAVTLDPLRAEYWLGLGLSQAQARRFGQAERAFQRGVDLSPYHTTMLTNLARAQIGRGLQGDRAAMARGYETARGAAGHDPYVPDVHYTLALAAWANGRWDEATAESERARKISPPPAGDAFAYEIAARAYLQIGRADTAESWAIEGLRINSTPSLAIVHARALLALGRLTDALTEIDGLLRADPGNAQALELKREISDRLQ